MNRYKNGVRHFSKGIFPRATSQVTISQVATSKMCNFPIGNFLKIRLGSLRRCGLQWGAELCGQDGLSGRALLLEQAESGALKLGQTREVAVWIIAHLGSCTRGKFFGKVPNIKYDVYGKEWKRMEKNGKEWKRMEKNRIHLSLKVA